MACVPKLGFDDIKEGKLAGFGKYQRNKGQTCQTDKFGKMKYHYCEAEGNGKQVCSQDPAPQNPACRKFFEENKQKIQDVPEDRDEIMILHIAKKEEPNPSFCFKKVNQEKSKYGWCQVEQSYYNPHGSGKKVTSWGYCSKDCYLDPDEGSNKLRIVEKAEVSIFPFFSCFLSSVKQYKV